MSEDRALNGYLPLKPQPDQSETMNTAKSWTEAEGKNSTNGIFDLLSTGDEEEKDTSWSDIVWGLNRTRFEPTYNEVIASFEEKVDKEREHDSDLEDFEPHRAVNISEERRREEESLKHSNDGDDLLCDQKYPEAIRCYGKALKEYPQSTAALINRSFCLDAMNEHELALKDALLAVALNRKDPKAHFRCGKAYVGLNRFADAEMAFSEAQSLNPCYETREELMKNREKALLDLGFEEGVASVASALYDSIAKAREEVKDVFTWKSNFNDTSISAPYEVEPEEEAAAKVSFELQQQERKEKYQKPQNLFGCKALLIFNISDRFSEDELRGMLAAEGNLLRMSYLKRQHCVYAHYSEATAPEDAVFNLEGRQLAQNPGTGVRFRFIPSDNQEDIRGLTLFQRESIYREGGECMKWRGKGCNIIGDCKFKHVYLSKYIDKELWLDSYN